ncbi:MAG: hypothetical protein H6739_28645 [Alphaproteobacteria bacterium]|nr:hypothetical protein [Alphaproteobacteria bacterium]
MIPLALLTLAACGDKDTVDSSPPTFTEVDTMLVQSCGFNSCHGTGTGGLTLDGDGDYDRLVNAASTGDPSRTLIVPGDPDNSYLLWKMLGLSAAAGEPMPPPSGGLDTEAAMVQAWIEAGAAND